MCDSRSFFTHFLDKLEKTCRIGSWRSYITKLLHIFNLCESFVDDPLQGFTEVILERERMNIMLKTKTLLATLIAAFGLMLGSTVTAWAGMPEYGFFDEFEGNTIIEVGS